jgi:type IX secretion system PorP/SprF family membrane protein
MIRLLLIFPLTFMFGMVLAQQDPQFSQYMFNNMSINPGFAGSKDAICLTNLNREQWVGFTGAPTDYNFTVNAPFKLFSRTSGIGLTALNDNIGFQNTLNFDLSYAYILSVKNGEGKLGLGVSVGFLSSTFDSKGGYYWGLGQYGTNEPIPVPGTTKETANTYDVGLGLYYHTDNLYMGASTTHLTESTFHYMQSGSFPMTRSYYLTTGYNMAFQDPAFEAQPSVMVRLGGVSPSVDLSTLIFYNKKIWGGLSYRINSALIGLVGLEMSNGIKVGFSYDFSLNVLTASTYELMLSYNFSLVKEKTLHKYRSVRFL